VIAREHPFCREWRSHFCVHVAPHLYQPPSTREARPRAAGDDRDGVHREQGDVADIDEETFARWQLWVAEDDG
jgi:hypothetical protein